MVLDVALLYCFILSRKERERVMNVAFLTSCVFIWKERASVIDVAISPAWIREQRLLMSFSYNAVSSRGSRKCKTVITD